MSPFFGVVEPPEPIALTGLAAEKPVQDVDRVHVVFDDQIARQILPAMPADDLLLLGVRP